jgi:acyl carrier protein
MDGAQVLRRLFADRRPDFVCLFSSNAAVLGGPGLATYAAANAAMDAFAQDDPADTTRWVSINWDAWSIDRDRSAARVASSLDAFAMTLDEGLGAFERVMSSRLAGQVVVSTANLDARLSQWLADPGDGEATDHEMPSDGDAHERPELEIAYVSPRDVIEERIARVWQDLLKIARIGMDDNFFDLGGTSVIALKIVSRLKKELGISVPVVTLFEAPTVGALARALAAPAAVDADDCSERRGSARREQRLVSASDGRA